MDFPVLICDDSHLAQRLLAKALPEDWSCHVLFAGDGNEALAILRTRHVALTLIDLSMPNMDGWQLLQAIRQENIETLCLVVTGDRQLETHKRALQAGATAVFNKPVNPDKLQAILAEYGLYSADCQATESTH